MDLEPGTSREHNISKRRQRDDTEDDGQKTKRHRVSRACDQCRLGRDKCDGKRPCHTCITNGRECDYKSSPKKRGIQSGYIRTLELCLTSLLHNDASLQGRLQSSLSDHTSPLRRAVAYKDTGSSNELYAEWTASLIPKLIDSVLTGAEDADLVGSLPVNDSTTRVNAPPVVSLSLPSNFWALLDQYYTFTHNWLPVSEKQQVLKTAYEYPLQEGLNQQVSNAGQHAELWAIVALTLEPSTQGNSSSDVIKRDPKLLHADIQAEKHARSFISSTDVAQEGSVTASLILALRSLRRRQSQAARHHIASAAINLALLSGIDGNNVRYSRLLAGCLVLDSVVATASSTPSLIDWQAFEQKSSLSEDGLEEWAPWSPSAESSTARVPGRCLSIFSALVGVCQTLSNTFLFHVMPATLDQNAVLHTPQALHLQIMQEWTRQRSGEIPTTSFMQSIGARLATFDLWGRDESMPATLIPLIDSLRTSLDNPVDRTGSQRQHLAQNMIPMMRSGTAIAAQDLGNTSNTIQADLFTPSLHASNQIANETSQQLLTSSTWMNNAQDVIEDQGGANKAPFSFVNNDHETPSAMSDGDARMSEFEALFEEMAQLDKTRQSNEDVQFMQNLGLDPDSDLRAFFGKDYRLSDPMYSYLPLDDQMQTNVDARSNFPM